MKEICMRVGPEHMSERNRTIHSCFCGVIVDKVDHLQWIATSVRCTGLLMNEAQRGTECKVKVC